MAAQRSGTGFWNSVNQLIAQSLMRALEVVVLDVLLDRVPHVSLAERENRRVRTSVRAPEDACLFLTRIVRNPKVF